MSSRSARNWDLLGTAIGEQALGGINHVKEAIAERRLRHAPLHEQTGFALLEGEKEVETGGSDPEAV